MYVAEPHVLDLPVFLEGHEVADADRLGDREQDAGDPVGERRARGEADHEAEHRRRGEHTGGDAPDRVELPGGEREADDHDQGEDEPPHEPQAGGGHGRELAAGDLLGDTCVAPPRQRAVHELGQNERQDDRDDW